ncbi:hypothetical protein BaRGS_00022004 [Batillaria attramentaria]|uniref:Tafazzin family protein n=1 Tax=Batillaria attramentaria TaxID=370345 RepID=A0ABD0KHN9_9CAEN
MLEGPKFNPDAWLFPSLHRTPRSWVISSRLVMAAVGSFSKVWIEWLNKSKVHNRQMLTDTVESRPPDRGLVTVSNHSSCMDDPLMWGVLKMRCLLSNSCMRWTPAAEDICYTNKWHSWFFSLGQCVPVRRGNGVYQKSMDFLLDKLNMGQWVHLFPEGKVNLTNEALLRFKWGVGRLITECKTSPIVLPIVHLGMDSVLPNEPPYIPQIRKNVTLLVGSPIDFSKDIERLKSLKKSPRDIRKYITDCLQEEVRQLLEKGRVLHSKFDS